MALSNGTEPLVGPESDALLRNEWGTARAPVRSRCVLHN
jgi:hypothetical protein